MRPIVRCLVLAACFFANPVLADSQGDVTGVWLVEDGEARVEIASCGAGLCGRIAWLRDPMDENGLERQDIHNPDQTQRDRRILGLEILRGFDPRPRKGVWKGGTVYDPKNGKTYRCKLTLDGKGRLRLRGYVGISLLGRTTVWTRVSGRGPSSASTGGASPGP